MKQKNDPQSPSSQNPSVKNKDMEDPRQDSSGGISDSGTPLENAREDAKAEQNAGRYPRIHTNHL